MDQKRGKLIVFEGFDGVGKTTLSKVFCERCGFEYHKSPEGAFSEARAYFDDEKIEEVERFSFYTGVALRNSMLLEKICRAGTNVVLDRHYYSVLAYHYSAYQELNHGIKEMYSHLIEPDLVIFLELDFSQIKERLLSQGRLNADDILYFNAESYSSIVAKYKNILPSNTIFVSNRGSVDQTYREISDNDLFGDVYSRGHSG